VTESELKARTKLFARRVLHLVEALPRSRSAGVVAGQLGRSGTSVGANYRSACRARSTADFISKLGIVEEEADESAFWMELIIEEGMLPAGKVQALWDEANAITAIMVSSRKTLGLRNQKSKTKNQK
jgi:four helix bundle protein